METSLQLNRVYLPFCGNVDSCTLCLFEKERTWEVDSVVCAVPWLVLISWCTLMYHGHFWSIVSAESQKNVAVCADAICSMKMIWLQSCVSESRWFDQSSVDFTKILFGLGNQFTLHLAWYPCDSLALWQFWTLCRCVSVVYVLVPVRTCHLPPNMPLPPLASSPRHAPQWTWGSSKKRQKTMSFLKVVEAQCKEKSWWNLEKHWKFGIFDLDNSRCDKV